MLAIVFAGTPEFAVPALDALALGEHRVLAVYTQPDRPAGRGRRLQASPVKTCAERHGLEVRQPRDFRRAEEVEALAALGADLMVVAAYGLLLPPPVLAAPRLGCVNIHASLLPRWRGASPIQQAILAGDPTSGVTLMAMDEGLDTGAMIARREIAIESDWSAGELHDALAPLGAELLAAALGDIENRLAAAVAQDEREATYAPRLGKADALVDWSRPAARLAREVRAFNPWPVSHTLLEGDNLRLWRAHALPGEAAPGAVVAHDADGVVVGCGEGLLCVTELQLAGRKRLAAGELLHARDLGGCLLGLAG